MKTRNALLLLALFVGGFLQQRNAVAGYPSYPPLQVGSYLVFEDSDNRTSKKACESGLPCVLAYYIPRGLTTAKTPSGIPMLTQGLFPSRESVWNHVVLYNITMEADLNDFQIFEKAAKEKLSGIHKVSESQILLSPMPMGSVQFVVRSEYGSGDTTREKPGADSESTMKDRAKRTVYTNYLVPKWTGAYHSIGSRFSVSIRGPMWDLEPSLQNMFLSEAGNAMVGNVSFSFPALASSLKATVTCDLKNFQQHVITQTKTWHHERVSLPFYKKEVFSNNEWNAARTNLDINAYCTFKEFRDTTVPATGAINQRAEQLFNRLFDWAFEKVRNAPVRDAKEGQDPKYTLYEAREVTDANARIEMNLEAEEVFLLSSDLEFYAGGVTRDKNLAPEHRFICDKWSKFDVATNACKIVCEPFTQVYLKNSPRADRNGCVDIDQVEVPHEN